MVMRHVQRETGLWLVSLTIHSIGYTTSSMWISVFGIYVCGTVTFISAPLDNYCISDDWNVVVIYKKGGEYYGK